MTRLATAEELSAALGLVELVNENLRLLNKALFGEEAKGSEDQFGQVGQKVAEHCIEASELLNKLRDMLSDEGDSNG